MNEYNVSAAVRVAMIGVGIICGESGTAENHGGEKIAD